MKETELAAPVVEWLTAQHWDVYQEVQFAPLGSIADIVAVRHGIIWIIECKVAYGLAVLGQASGWWEAHYRSVAVPRSREPRDYRVAKDYYKVGILEVSTGFDGILAVNELSSPPLFLRHRDNMGIRRMQHCLATLTELHKTFAQAGSNKHDHLTPYKQTMMDVRKVVEKNPGCTIKFLYEQLGEMHYSSKASFMGNLVKSLVDFEKDWCKVDTSARPYKLFLKSV